MKNFLSRLNSVSTKARPRSLRITKKGLQAIQVEDEAPGSAEPAKKAA
jgi:hypothetical protein